MVNATQTASRETADLLFRVGYNAAYSVFAGIFLPHFWMRSFQADDRSQLLRERRGRLDSSKVSKLKRKPVIWLHAVSVGEVLAVRPFIQRALEQLPGYQWLLTTVTPTGQKMAHQLEGENVTVAYCPFDWTACVRRFISAVQPKVLLLAETEIWPGLLTQCSHDQVPVILLNARLSEKSFRRYQRFGSWFRPLFEKLRAVLAQSAEDGNRFQVLGTLEERIQVMGNMKFDAVAHRPESEKAARELSQKWNFPQKDRLWIAGSTHEGEELICLHAFSALRKKTPGVKLLIAPRHIERAGSILKQASGLGFEARLSSGSPQTYEVLVLDQLGVLSSVYQYAALAFIGGSLVKRGGQNPIEPALMNCAVLHGPHTFNFRLTYDALQKNQASRLICGAEDLERILTDLFEHSETRHKLAAAAYETVCSLRGAADRQFNWFLNFINQWERTKHANHPEELFSPSRGRV